MRSVWVVIVLFVVSTFSGVAAATSYDCTDAWASCAAFIQGKGSGYRCAADSRPGREDSYIADYNPFLNGGNSPENSWACTQRPDNPCADPNSSACMQHCDANPVPSDCPEQPDPHPNPCDPLHTGGGICVANHDNCTQFPTAAACVSSCSPGNSNDWCSNSCSGTSPASSCPLNCLQNPLDPRCVPTPICEEHPEYQQCQPGTLAYCALHPTDAACTPAKPYCVEHPDADGCKAPEPFCHLHPDDPACVAIAPWCHDHPTDAACNAPEPYCKLHPNDPVCLAPVPYCVEHPTDAACSSPPPWCHDHPADPSCAHPESSPPWCHDHPDDPSCNAIPQNPPWCHEHPDDPSCKSETPGGQLQYCDEHPDSVSCAGAAPIDCGLHPTDSRCAGNGGDGIGQYCASHPTANICRTGDDGGQGNDPCTDHPERAECQGTNQVGGGGDCDTPPSCSGGDPAQCAILRQTWEARCSAGHIGTGTADFSQGLFGEGTKVGPDDSEIHGQIDSMKDRIEQVPIVRAADGFFTLNLSGTCPTFDIPNTEVWAGLDPGILCNGTLDSILEWVGYVVLAVAAFAAIRIAIH